MKTEIRVPVISPLEPGGETRFATAAVRVVTLRADQAPIALTFWDGRKTPVEYRTHQGALWKVLANKIVKNLPRDDLTLLQFKSGWHPLSPTRHDANHIRSDVGVGDYDRTLEDTPEVRATCTFKAIEARADDTIIVDMAYCRRSQPPFWRIQRDPPSGALATEFSLWHVDERIDAMPYAERDAFERHVVELTRGRISHVKAARLTPGPAFDEDLLDYDAPSSALEAAIWLAVRATCGRRLREMPRFAVERVAAFREDLERRLPDHRLRFDETPAQMWPFERDAFEFPDASLVAAHLYAFVAEAKAYGIPDKTLRALSQALLANAGRLHLGEHQDDLAALAAIEG